METKFVDQATDAAEYDRLVSSCKNVPSYVERPLAAASKEHQKLASVAFADPAGRLFPIHDKSSTWLSIASFSRQAAMGMEHPDMDKIAESLDFAADLNDITQAEKVAAFESAEAAVEAMKPAPTFMVKVGSREFKVPESNGTLELAKVASWMYLNCAAIPFSDRMAAAGSILKEASAHNYDLMGFKPLLEKSAGLAIYDNESLKSGLRDRMLRCKLPDYQKTATATFDTSKMTFAEACEVLEEMDKNAMLNKVYMNSDVQLPEFVLTRDPPVVEKVAVLVRDIPVETLEKNAFQIASGMELNAFSTEAVIEAVRGMSDENVRLVKKIINHS